jgi:FPC/CPF motif-containing protein YcgG
VFNPHEQFERLRADGHWKRMQETIRRRDLELQGSINPMLSDFGEQSEARQYSGRAVEDNWRAPFKAVAGKCPFAH